MSSFGGGGKMAVPNLLDVSYSLIIPIIIIPDSKFRTKVTVANERRSRCTQIINKKNNVQREMLFIMRFVCMRVVIYHNHCALCACNITPFTNRRATCNKKYAVWSLDIHLNKNLCAQFKVKVSHNYSLKRLVLPLITTFSWQKFKNRRIAV